MIGKLWKMAGWLAVAVIPMAGRNICLAYQFPSDQLPRVSAEKSPITPVVGESWLSHLNRPFGDTSMGKTWYLGPPPSTGEENLSHRQQEILIGCTTQTTTLHGSDLYRLNCRGCHGEAGLGVPPEINSVIDPVRATSVALVIERMKKTGADMSRAQATQLAQQAQVALVQRLHSGGKNMPSFPQLHEAEIRSILAYLRQLAGIPGAENEQIAVTESPIRVGELIAKSTCHICHSAVGVNPSPEELMNGAIPPLQTLTRRKNQSGLVEKVTQGAPILMGAPAMLARGRMPVFRYLTADEAADVYLYLSLYPPSESPIVDSVATTSQPHQTATLLDHTSSSAGALAEVSHGRTEAPPSISLSEAQLPWLLLGLGSSVVALIVFGLIFTLWQFRKLSPRNRSLALAVCDIRTDPYVACPEPKYIFCRTFSGTGEERRSRQMGTDETGGLTRKNRREERQCHGTRLG